MNSNADTEFLPSHVKQTRIDDHTKAIFVIRLKADRDDASIRALRWLLKRARRDFGMIALSVREEVAERREDAA